MSTRLPTDSRKNDGWRARPRPRVLLAEDDVEMRRLLAATLRRDGCEVLEAADGNELLAFISDEVIRAGGIVSSLRIDLIVSDIRMPGLTGLAVLAGLHEARLPIPVVLVTAFGDDETHRLARRHGAAVVLDKPFGLDDFRSAVLRLVGSA